MLDPTKLKDWQIAEASEETARPIVQIANELGIKDEEIIPMGRLLAKIDYRQILNRLGKPQKAKYIDVTAITPTPLGEAKQRRQSVLSRGWANSAKRLPVQFVSQRRAYI
jgi:formate--tetrahydrofolate ligase